MSDKWKDEARVMLRAVTEPSTKITRTLRKWSLTLSAHRCAKCPKHLCLTAVWRGNGVPTEGPIKNLKQMAEWIMTGKLPGTFPLDVQLLVDEPKEGAFVWHRKDDWQCENDDEVTSMLKGELPGQKDHDPCFDGPVIKESAALADAPTHFTPRLGGEFGLRSAR